MTATAARAQLQAAITAAAPLTPVYPMPPLSLAGPSIVLEPAGWSIQNATQVVYRVDVHTVLNAPDTSSALEALETLAAAVWLAALGAGWSPGDMGGPQAVTYADQPNLSMTFTASRLVTLAS